MQSSVPVDIYLLTANCKKQNKYRYDLHGTIDAKRFTTCVGADSMCGANSS